MGKEVGRQQLILVKGSRKTTTYSGKVYYEKSESPSRAERPSSSTP